MRTFLGRAGLLSALWVVGAGCATAASDGAGGAGGSDATSTVSSTVASTASSTTSVTTAATSTHASSSVATSATIASSSTGPNLCGNGMVDPGETCDGTNFGGKTCVDYGLAGGMLQCNQYCGIVVAGCTPAENCTNQTDDDEDGLTDCDDPDCAAATACTDPCSSPLTMQIGFSDGQIDGRPNVLHSSCMPQAGREVVYAFTAAATGDVSVLAEFADFDPGLAVRTTCNDAATQIACVNQTGPNGSEELSFSATAGQTYYVILESVDNQPGFYDLDTEQILPESDCTNLSDDDLDGYVDCDDATACQGTSACISGAKAAGQNCFGNTECSSVNGDPVCLTDQLGYTDGYCSEFCNLQTNDCPSADLCVQNGLSHNGVCMQTCVNQTDCTSGFSCLDEGLAKKICDKPPELNCDDYADNDNDNLVDCEDPTACSTSPSCVPGTGAVGTPCQLHSQCQSNGTDPYCIDDAHDFFTGGYCSEFCNLQADDCPAGSVCSDYLSFASGHGVCLKTCSLQTDCRSGYFCESDFTQPKTVCLD